MKEFNLSKFQSLAKTLSFLAEKQGQCKIISGGTDLTIALRKNDKKLEKVKFILDISSLEELKRINEGEQNLKMGAATNFTKIIHNETIQKQFPLLSEAAKKIGSPQIRNLGTIGGNICNLAPSADSIAPLLIYNADIKLMSANNSRTISIKQFLPNEKSDKLDLRNDELLAQIILPIEKNISEANTKFIKLGRRKSVSISRMSFAVLLKKDKDKIIEDIRIGTGAVFRFPCRLFAIEKKYVGKQIRAELPAQISRDIAFEVLEKTGIRWSSEYKLPTLQAIIYNVFHKLFNHI